jgi:branched-chain amino acid transport system ATP-binding protein
VTAPTLEFDGVSVAFGGVRALDGVSFRIDDQQIVGLIGPNGAGKTTAFNCVSRFVRPTSGRLRAWGTDLADVAPHEVVRHGIARTYQGLELFDSMTVGETLLAGQHSRRKGLGAWASALSLPSIRASEAEWTRRARETADFFSIEQYWDRRATDLPYGIQKRIDMARALVARPKLLLLDEPAAGLNIEALDELATLIRTIRDEFRSAVLLVEHHVAMVMALCDRVCVLNFGKVIADDVPDVVRRDPAVVEAYLGATVAEGA